MTSLSRIRAAAGALAVLVLVAAPSVRARPLVPDVDVLTSHDCDDITPPETASPVTPLSAAIEVKVLLLLDGVPAGRAADIARRAAQAYAPLGVKLHFTSRPARFTATEARALFEEMRAVRKSLHRSKRLPEHQVLHLLTVKDVKNGGSDTLGVAACIGGIERPDSALSLSEVGHPDRGRAVLGLPVLTWEVRLAATTLAHEIGHLFGARHELGNCIEGGADPAEPTVVRPCTLMTGPGGSANALRFGALEQAVVRGYAEKYAA